MQRKYLMSSAGTVVKPISFADFRDDVGVLSLS
jgi:hypothetical protein